MFVFSIRANGSTVIENGYDDMGRRYMKKVTLNGVITLHHHYLYRGYLQIAALDILHGGKQKHALFWDPTEPLATRPLVLLTSDDNRYTYAHDLTKNVTELLDAEGNIAAAYDYDPFGKVTEAGVGAGLNPIQWSSEVYDAELGLVYYNFRHYNPADGRWINRDPISEQGGVNLYGFIHNVPFKKNDFCGLESEEERLAKVSFLKYYAMWMGENEPPEPIVGTPSQKDFQDLHDLVNKYNRKTKDGKKCWTIVIQGDLASLETTLVSITRTDYTFIISHGDENKLLTLKDVNISYDLLNRIAYAYDHQILPFACYFNYTKDVPQNQHGTFLELKKSLQSLLESQDCPCKSIRILSGPVNVFSKLPQIINIIDIPEDMKRKFIQEIKTNRPKKGFDVFNPLMKR